MAHTIGLRATSFVASALLLGLATLAAMSISVTLRSYEFGGPAPVPVVTVRPDPPPPPRVAREAPPRPPVDDDVATSETSVSELPPIAQDEFVGAVSLPPGPAEITNPRWLRRPRDLASYYPHRALDRGVAGEVVLNCLVETNGMLSCAVTSETPPNWGFAAAALRISRDHRMAPATRDGSAVQGRYRMRVPFEVR